MRARLLEAGMTALETTPARMLSVRDLARAVGVSHAAPYRHFGDLDGFRRALAASALGSLVAAQDARIHGVIDARTRLELAGLEYVRWAHANAHAFQLAFDPEVNDPSAPTPELATAIDAHTSLLTGLVAAAAPDAADAQELGVALWAAVHGLADLIASGRVPEQTVSASVEIALRMLD